MTPTPALLDPNAPRPLSRELYPDRVEGARVHVLKCWPTQFWAVVDLEKSAELRRNDRDFGDGDLLKLREWDPAALCYTGQQVWREVTHVLTGMPGLQPGFTVLSIRPLSASLLGAAERACPR